MPSPWLSRLATLKAARTAARGIAPHKPLMLLTVTVDGCHPLADHHQLPSLVRRDVNRVVGRVQGEEFDAVVLPGVFGDGFGGVVFFHREASAVFRVAHPSSLRYAVASSVFARILEEWIEDC